MKKVWRCLSAFVLTFLLFSLSFAVFNGGGFGKSNMDALAQSDILGVYGVSIEYDSNVFKVATMEYTLDGIKIEYNESGIIGDDGAGKYRITYSGTPGPHELMTGDARVVYSDTEPFIDNEMFSGYGLTLNKIPADANTDVKISFAYLTDIVYKHYYLSELSYRGVTGSYNTIDTTTLNNIGDAEFNGDFGTFDEVIGQFVTTVNNNTFRYNHSKVKGAEVTIVALGRDTTLKLTSAHKIMGVTFSGDGASIGSTNKVAYSYTDYAEIKLTPSSGEIVESATLYFGDTKIITLYGGMQTAGVYSYAGGVAYEKQISYGNFALGYESDFNFLEVETDSNNVLLEIVKDGEEELEDHEDFHITLDDSGVVTITSHSLSKWVTIDVTTQKYAQIDLQKVDDGVGQFSSDPFCEVVIGEGANQVVYTENIPSRIFAIGFSESIYVRVKLNEKYNFTDSINPIFIEGSYFIHEAFPGGEVVISAEKEETYTVSVFLYKDGELFKDSSTKIYLSTRDITSAGEFEASELSAVSSEGWGTKRGVDGGSTLKIYIEVSHYYIMKLGEESYSKYYLNLEYLVTNNQSIDIVIENFNMERPVLKDGEEIGTIKIDLERVTSFIDEDGNLSHHATYQARFRNASDDYYNIITKTNPSIYGFNLVNMSVNGVDILTYYADGSFGIDPEDTTLHAFLASTVFNVPINSFSIDARFTAKLNQFSFMYNNNTYIGYSYYGATEMFLEVPVDVVETGMYFGGLSYYAGSDKIELLTVEKQTPVEMTDGEFKGMTKYLLETPWNLDDPGMLLEVLILYSTYEIEFVFTSSGDEHQSIKSEIKYNTKFTVDDFNIDDWADPTIGEGYNLIGWNAVDDEEVFFIKADESEFLYRQEFTYYWTFNIRLIPVFSAETAVITVFDDDTHLNSLQVRYGDPVDLNALLKVEGEWITLSRFGYTFLGFFDAMSDGTKIFEFSDGADPRYITNINASVFGGDEENGLTWALLSNLNLYSRFTPILYSLDLTIVNGSYKGTENVVVSAGTIESVGADEYYVSGFNITDLIILSGLSPKTNAFISKITFNVVNSSGESLGEAKSFVSLCDRDGVVTSEAIDNRFNSDDFTLSILVADFVNEETDGAHIKVKIEYLPVTYIVSFTANFVDEDGKVLLEDSSSTVYYKMEVADANVNKASMWQLCNEEGEVISQVKGWQSLRTHDTQVEFTGATLSGISGISQTINGVKYSFKYWRDFEDGVDLNPSLIIDKGYDFVSMFSDKYDVTVNYYIYNDTTGAYVKHAYTGYFWENNMGSYTLGAPLTANAYEIYIVGGKLYYISAWSNISLSSFGQDVSEQNKFGLVAPIVVGYQAVAFDVNFYAIYTEFNYSLTETTDEYLIEANLPNDPNGNSYTEDDIIWVTAGKAEYDGYNSTSFSVADKLTQILGLGDAITLNTVGAGKTFSKSVSISDDNYLFAVVQRKVDGANQKSFYMAIKVI